VWFLIQSRALSPVSEARPGAPASEGSEAKPATTEPGITIDLGAVKQNSKSRKTGVSTVDIALSNIEKAQLIPEMRRPGMVVISFVSYSSQWPQQVVQPRPRGIGLVWSGLYW